MEPNPGSENKAVFHVQMNLNTTEEQNLSSLLVPACIS